MREEHNASAMARREGNGDAYRLLIEQVIAGGGLAAVIRLLSDMLGLPAGIVDDELEPLHAFAPRGRHLSPAESGLWRLDGDTPTFDLTQMPRASTAPPVARVRGVNGHEYAVAPVVLPSGIVGYVWASDPSGQLSSRVDGVVSHAAAACALEMVRQRAIVEGESRVRNSFLEDLLAGNITSVSATRRRARFLGYDLRHEQAVFVLDLDFFSDYIASHEQDESEIQRLKDRFRRGVEACIPAIWERALVWEHSDALVLLARAREGEENAFRQRVEALRAAVEARLAGPSISAGIGRPYADLHKLRQSYQEAEHAVRIGLATRGPSSTTAFEELGAYRLLFLLRDQPELQAYYEETIGPLLRYDEEHDSTLTQTLATFLELQGNLSETARRLHLHRNGLLYRLSRIEKILDARLDSATQRLALQLALLARPLLNDMSAPGALHVARRHRAPLDEGEGKTEQPERPASYVTDR